MGFFARGNFEYLRNIGILTTLLTSSLDFSSIKKRDFAILWNCLFYAKIFTDNYRNIRRHIKLVE